MRVARAAFLLLPLAGVLAVDPAPFDFHAVKYLALALVALVAAIGGVAAGCFAWTQLSAPLWIFTAVRGLELLRAPPSGRALRWWSLLFALTVLHHVAAAAAPRRWLERRLVPMLGGLGAAVALYAILQRFTDARQAHAFFANRSFAGAGLAMLLPYAYAWRRFAVSALVLAGLLATGSRGGMLAAAVVVAAWASRRVPRFSGLVLAGVPAVVLAAGLWLGDANTVKVRLHWYEAAWTLGAERPWIGHGAGGFEREYPPIRSAEEYAISGGRRVHAVHDDYLEAWANGGLRGLGAMLLLVVLALRAARAHDAVFASWIAFSTAALVDLPWRDPALLTLALVPLSMVAERRALLTWARPLAAAGAAGMLALLPAVARHWVADREFGRHAGGAGDLDRVLAWEPGHPEALLARGRPGDLDRLLEQRPHDAGAWLNRTRSLPDDQAIAALRTVLREHDPHDALCRLQLAKLHLRAGDPVAASLVLGEALEHPLRPPADLFLLQARLLRERGELERAEYWIDRVPPAQHTTAFRQEMLEIELARLRQNLWDAKRIDFLVRNLPPTAVQERIEEPLARAEAVVAARPRPDVPRREGESTEEHLARVHEAQADWGRRLRADTVTDFREAFLLAEALCRHRPTVERLRQKARAARGLGDVERAGHFESQALFLETLDALAATDPVTARRRFELAIRAYPGLSSEPEAILALRAFAEANPEAVPLARELFSAHERFIAALER